MFCKWELQEDCTNLRALMLRFDSEEELDSHELGRSLLFMVRNEDVDVDGLPTLHHIERAANLLRWFGRDWQQSLWQFKISSRKCV